MKMIMIHLIEPEPLRKLEWGDRIPTGIIYKSERPTFEEHIPVIREKSLVEQEFQFNVKKLIEKFL